MSDNPVDQAINRIRQVGEEFQQELRRFDGDLESARILSTDTLYKIVVLSTGIIGFSVTLFSVPTLDLTVNTNLLRLSWKLLLLAIISGMTSLFLEARIKYVLAWRGFQLRYQSFDPVRLPLWDRARVVLVAVYSILLSPRNLIFCRGHRSEAEKQRNADLNGATVMKLAEWVKLPLLLEMIFMILFLTGLWLLVESYG